MKYLHLYNSQTDYDNKKNTLILPTVSLIEENNHVEYNPHQYVEIAGIKWATMNVGAKSITDYGLYFQWGDTQGYTADQVTGDTEPKKAFSSGDYNIDLMTKYNETGMTLDLDDDAVHVAWGGSWRMPTTGEMQTVLNSTAVTTGWTDSYSGSGVAGMVLTDNNSNETLFLPACGFANGGAVSYAGVHGNYWLSSLNTGDVGSAYYLYFNSDGVNVNYSYRYDGQCVRGVLGD